MAKTTDITIDRPKAKARGKKAAAAPAPALRIEPKTNFDDCPEGYAVTFDGDAFAPAIKKGQDVVFSVTEEPMNGDVVAVWFKPDCIPPGQPQCTIWYQEIGIGKHFKLPYTHNPKSEVRPVLMVRSAADDKVRVIEADKLLAVHRRSSVARRREREKELLNASKLDLGGVSKALITAIKGHFEAWRQVNGEGSPTDEDEVAKLAEIEAAAVVKVMGTPANTSAELRYKGQYLLAYDQGSGEIAGMPDGIMALLQSMADGAHVSTVAPLEMTPVSVGELTDLGKLFMSMCDVFSNFTRRADLPKEIEAFLDHWQEACYKVYADIGDHVHERRPVEPFERHQRNWYLTEMRLRSAEGMVELGGPGAPEDYLIDDPSELSVLSREFEQAWQAEWRAKKVGASEEELAAAVAAVSSVVDKIKAVPARSLSDLRIKARAVQWAASSGDWISLAPVNFAHDKKNPTTDVELGAAVVNDLLFMDDPAYAGGAKH